MQKSLCVRIKRKQWNASDHPVTIAGTTPTRLATRVATKMDPQHPHSHSLSMLGAERYQNQLNSTANAELFKWVYI